MADSAMQVIKNKAGLTASQTQSFPELLKMYSGEIARALPKHVNPDRMMRIALTAFRQNPALASCDPKSIFAAIIIASQLGLEVGILGQAYLVPYKKECQLIPGWRGMVDLVNRAGKAQVWTGAVYRGDSFEYKLGDAPYVQHEPGDDEQTPDALTYVYAIGRVKGHQYPIVEVWSKAKVEKHRNRFNKVGDRHYSYQHFEAYARKVVLLQVMKMVPLSVEFANAYALDEQGEKGTQVLRPEEAAKGEWVGSLELAPPDGAEEMIALAEPKNGDYGFGGNVESE